MPNCDRSKQRSNSCLEAACVLGEESRADSALNPPLPTNPLSLDIAFTLKSTFPNADPQLFFTIVLGGVKAGGIIPISYVKRVRWAGRGAVISPWPHG